jgi:hypothetical protein
MKVLIYIKNLILLIIGFAIINFIIIEFHYKYGLILQILWAIFILINYIVERIKTENQ